MRRKALRDKALLVGLVIFGINLIFVVFGPIILTHDPSETDLTNRLRAPSSEWLFGSDEFGRDVFSRIVAGARYSLGGAFLAVVGGLAVGATLGILSGYFGGIPDSLIMRAMDIVLGLPYFVLSILFVTILGPTFLHAVEAVSIGQIPTFARVVRSGVLTVKTQDYVMAARAIGSTGTRVMWKTILPNVASLIIVVGTLQFSGAILSIAALGFLGLGAQPPMPEWGTMLNSGRKYLFIAPRLSMIPGGAIMLASLAINLIGDGLRDRLDPTLRRGV